MYFIISNNIAVLICTVYQVSDIDGRSPLGLKPENIDQVVELKNVHFSYPARPDVPVRLQIELSMKIVSCLYCVGTTGA